jgi:hypothetical protein
MPKWAGFGGDGKWYTKRFGMIQPDWYVFAFGKPWPGDPTRPIMTLKTSWQNVKTKAKVKGRWHDNRHTLIADLAESGAGGRVGQRPLDLLVAVGQRSRRQQDADPGFSNSSLTAACCRS